MRFKPVKSRSMVLRKGKVLDNFCFGIAGTAIPTITEKPVKSLGKVFDSSLRDSTSIQSTCAELDGWLKSLDKSSLPGKFKAWFYQHGVLPRILWPPVLIYADPISAVETLERSPWAQQQTAAALQILGRGIQVRSGRKWRAEKAVQEAEARLRHRSLVRVVTRGRARLGSFPTPQRNTRGKERRRLVQEEVRATVEETKSCKAVGMKNQGAWTRWENAVERKVTWAEIWKAKPQRIKFLIWAVYDVLPNPSNLHTWGIAETTTCPLCSKRGTLEHILSCCTMALGEGRYRWRHDLRPSLKPSALDLCGQSSFVPPRKPSPSSELGSRQPWSKDHRQASGPLLETGSCWWTSNGS
ncbi:hypothetical protein SRHO_G00249420 [Serrasalmus rhombeus]